MKIIKICLLLISLAFIDNLFCAAARENLLKSFEESHDTSYIPQGEAGFKKILDLIHSPEYKKQKTNGQIRNARGQTLLFIAIMALRTDIVLLLLDNGESIYSVDNTQSDALEVANNVKDHIDNNIHANDVDRTEYGENVIKGGIDLKKDRERLLNELKSINKIIELIKLRQDIHLSARVLLSRMDQTIPEEGLTGIPTKVRDIILEYLQA